MANLMNRRGRRKHRVNELRIQVVLDTCLRTTSPTASLSYPRVPTCRIGFARWHVAGDRFKSSMQISFFKEQRRQD
ncbi:hypothetical protein F7734_00490 [Scytonema sp. UIC 10036]|uniref:hypothetical protein n=1 Tax=Scytonema sp. UIC 10036 TaxID=2304196 RepID=UPI0012DA8F70|nr:hypothetical protein [Scytonema sp. UIC 10036]MUG91059.1 hypothetical protein [Scytonema sp. UIC 10036]